MDPAALGRIFLAASNSSRRKRVSFPFSGLGGICALAKQAGSLAFLARTARESDLDRMRGARSHVAIELRQIKSAYPESLRSERNSTRRSENGGRFIAADASHADNQRRSFLARFAAEAQNIRTTCCAFMASKVGAQACARNCAVPYQNERSSGGLRRYGKGGTNALSGRSVIGQSEGGLCASEACDEESPEVDCATPGLASQANG